MNPFFKIWSFFLPIRLKIYPSDYSNQLEVAIEDGVKVLNTKAVNYSFNSLHRIFKEAFKKSNLHINHNSRVLMLGLGAGSIVKIIRKEYASKALITAVEIDPVVVDIATREFKIKEWGNPIHIINMDAFDFVQETKTHYSLICVDIFIHDIVPDKFLSSHFLLKAVHLLEQGGQLYFNFMDSNEAGIQQFKNLISDLKNVSSITRVEQLYLEKNNQVLVVTR